jgi:hypothetical protein
MLEIQVSHKMPRQLPFDETGNIADGGRLRYAILLYHLFVEF